MTQYNEQLHEYGPGYVMVADVQGSKASMRGGGAVSRFCCEGGKD